MVGSADSGMQALLDEASAQAVDDLVAALVELTLVTLQQTSAATRAAAVHVLVLVEVELE